MAIECQFHGLLFYVVLTEQGQVGNYMQLVPNNTASRGKSIAVCYKSVAMCISKSALLLISDQIVINAYMLNKM